MNRLKQELRKRGVRLECDFPTLPYNGIDTVIVDSEKAIVSTYHYSAGWIRIRLQKDGTILDYIKIPD